LPTQTTTTTRPSKETDLDTHPNRAALAVDAILGRTVRLTYKAERNEAHAEAGVRGEWYNHFMAHLASIGFNGSIDWCYEWTDGQHCVALEELSHPDNAIHLATSIALDTALMHGNDGWQYSWYVNHRTHCARTMLMGSYLMDATFVMAGDSKNGWRFVMPMLNTNAIHNTMHRLPRSVAAWNMGQPNSEQVA